MNYQEDLNLFISLKGCTPTSFYTLDIKSLQKELNF